MPSLRSILILASMGLVPLSGCETKVEGGGSSAASGLTNAGTGGGGGGGRAAGPSGDAGAGAGGFFGAASSAVVASVGAGGFGGADEDGFGGGSFGSGGSGGSGFYIPPNACSNPEGPSTFGTSSDEIMQFLERGWLLCDGYLNEDADGVVLKADGTWTTLRSKNGSDTEVIGFKGGATWTLEYDGPNNASVVTLVLADGETATGAVAIEKSPPRLHIGFDLWGDTEFVAQK